MTEAIQRDIQDLKESVKSLDRQHRVLESRQTEVVTSLKVNQVINQNTEKRLGSIELTLQRLVWLVLASLVSAIMAYILGGGLTIGK